MTYTVSQIDDANLNWHYTRETHPDGVYYRLKSGDARFPAGFWESEWQDTQSQHVTASNIQQLEATAPYTAQAPESYSYQEVLASPLLEDRVVTIRVVAHTLGPVMPNGDLSQNHWTIYLRLNRSGSVQINMKTDPRPSVVQGVYEVTRRSYTESRTAVRWWDFPAVNSLAILQIEQEISSKGWHRYNMTAGGVGCRHWVYGHEFLDSKASLTTLLVLLFFEVLLPRDGLTQMTLKPS